MKSSRELIVEDISPEKLTQIVDDMDSDDATDLIGELAAGTGPAYPEQH